MSNPVSSMIFCARNFDKAENENKVGRWAVVAGQAKKVTDYVVTLDNQLGKESKAAVDVLSKHAKNEKLLDFAGKAVNLASKNINPLICVSSGIDVLRSDDKESTAVVAGSALATMFVGENLMKKHLDDIPKIKGVDKIAEKVMKVAKDCKIEGKVPAIIHGVAFVVGSCTAYNVGEKFGKLLMNKPEKETDVNKKAEGATQADTELKH